MRCHVDGAHCPPSCHVRQLSSTFSPSSSTGIAAKLRALLPEDVPRVSIARFLRRRLCRRDEATHDSRGRWPSGCRESGNTFSL